MKRILIAGVGNIFLGDDAFGSEVVRALARRRLPGGVCLVDFGIRSYDLAYALGEYEATILVDAISRGDAPGTTSLVEIDPEDLPGADASLPDAHSLNPLAVLQMGRALGTLRGKIYLIGCEPVVLETENGEIGLSRVVQAAVPTAVEMAEALAGKLLQGELTMETGAVPA